VPSEVSAIVASQNMRTLLGRRLAARVRAADLVVAAIVVVALALHVSWLVRFRSGYVTEWDESGYLQFALSNFDALHDHGIWTFAKTVGGRGTFGPLLPFVTSLTYPIVTRSIFGSLLTLLLFYSGLVAATYGLARRFVADAWAVVAALAVAAMPAVTDYARLYHFALPTTACMTAALWALVRSDRFRRAPWAVAFGFFVALTLLARTMAVAFVPGFLLAAVLQFVVGTPEAARLRLRNFVLAVATAAIVAGPWYLVNARSVYDLYVGSGYGEGAAAYGHHYPLASWGYWTKELRLDLSYLWLPLSFVLLLCFALALAYRRGSGRRGWDDRVAGVSALVVVVLEGYLALTSSRNEGTAFALPWLPLLVVLGVLAAASLPVRAVRTGLAAALVAVSIVGVLSKSGWVAPLATVRSVHVPGFGRVVVTDGRGIIQGEVQGDGYRIGSVTHPLPSMHKRWLPLAREVVGWGLDRADRRGEPLNLTLGLDDRIFGNSRLILAAQLWFHRYLPVDYLQASAGGDTVESYRRQLLAPRPENALVTGEPPPNGSSITRRKVEQAARSLGFVRMRSLAMPDGRRIWLWWR
jgi:4-amino-4-deoxy-L-arabinose transferase-like glycosyltransferase